MAGQSLKTVKSGLFTKKWGLLAISLMPVWLVLFVKNVDIPVYFGVDWQFVNWEKLVTYRNFVASISLLMTLTGVLGLHQLRHRMKGSPEGLSTTVSKVNDRSYDYVNTLTTIVTLLGVVLVSVDTLRGFLIFNILMIFIIVCHLKTNLYYCNPIFAVLGFRLYIVNGKGMQNESIAIYRGELQDGDSVKFYHISENVFYLI